MTRVFVFYEWKKKVPSFCYTIGGELYLFLVVKNVCDPLAAAAATHTLRDSTTKAVLLTNMHTHG